MQKVELDYEPLVVGKTNEIICEMSDSQLAFLCGIIKSKRPKKIVEVGVAHGGTTCVIIQCLKMLGYPVELHSVDILEECYRAKGRRTGYCVDLAFSELPDNISHKWHLGRSLPQELDSIGKDIDVIILDTMHIMPGEMLDFLAAFPYLSQNAVVVLHDIILNQISLTDMFGYATRIVYDVVVAEKIVADGIDSDKLLPNIGAFAVNEDTQKYIEKCFSILSVNWVYDLTDEMLNQYMEIYSRHYDDELLNLFKRIVTINRNRLQQEKDKTQQAKETIVNFHKNIDNNHKLVLFGGGAYAERISCYLEQIGRKVDAYVISDSANLEECKIKKNIYHFSELPFLPSECNIIIALSRAKHNEVLSYLEDSRFHSVYPGVYDDYNKFIKFVDENVYIRESLYS